jgi:hypothetical protein
MVRSCEREGWSGGKLDLVSTSWWCIDDSAWFLKAWICCSCLFFLVIFGAVSWRFSWSDLGTILLGIWWGCMHESFVVLFHLIPLPNPWAKGLVLGFFGVLGLEEFLAGFLRFLLIWKVLVDKILAMDSPWGVPTIPKVLRKSVERFGRSRVGFGGVDSRVLFIPRAQATPAWPVPLTGLTGADPSWGFARVNVWVSSLLSRVATVSSLGQFGAR